MTAFELCGTLALPFWALMVFLPTWSVTRRIIGSPWIVAPAAVIYLIVLLPVANFVLPEVASPVQARIMQLLGTPTGTTLAWAHFIAFDLFVGRWIYCDSRSRMYSPWWVSPILVLTLLVGPVGLLLYLVARTV
ncbi:MAG TPA: ABA4-like family protein, partial [Luteitalea sp.]|nr:ABA4-like family protein [Luteitalea sp.]